MPQVPVGRFSVLDAEIANRILGLLSSLPAINIPYAQIGPLCAALQTAPILTVQDGQDIGLVEVQPLPAEPAGVSGDADPTPEDPGLHVVGDEAPKTGLPPKIQEEAK